MHHLSLSPKRAGLTWVTRRSLDISTDASCHHHQEGGDVARAPTMSRCTPHHTADALNAVG
eukprot:7198092-Pyramimonas_sp.AAC.1